MADLETTLRSSLGGRYAIEEEVGRGGMSVVFRARDLKHDRPVAIKVLRPELSEQIGADRFHREVEFAANLSNPHILPLFDSGEADGNLFYVMPCIEEGSLRERIDAAGPLNVDEALGIARDVASALGAAHQQDIVHRDIKPANILFSGGEAVVADFGIARATEVEDRDRLTQSGLSVGSPAYMSPEQAAGDPVDGRSDIYSLGCVLYTMLTGEPPFFRDTAQAMAAAQIAAPPPSARNSRPEVPKGVDEIILTALQKNPDNRFATAQELIDALEHPEEMPERAKERRRRERIRAVSTTAAVLFGVLGVSWLAWQAFAPEPLPAADANRVMVFPLQERGEVEPGAGIDAALTIETVLLYADPLTFVDGWTWLDADQRSDASLVTADVARSTALGQGARWYVTGAILGTGDSATVTLFLHDAVADTAGARERATGDAGPSGIADAGLDATTRLLPVLLEPGREIDPAVVAAAMSSSPVAMLEWIEGDKAYRASRFAEALDRYRAALEADSAWAFAAMKAAQAASWIKDTLALDLVDRALEDSESLPPRYATFARGLQGYLTANPDLAIEQFEAAIAIDSAWAEPWTALGEVYYHLLPTWEDPDVAARFHFERSWAMDSSFVVPLYHLTQMALRRGDVGQAASLVERFRGAAPETSMVAPLELALRCVANGPASVPWDSVVTAAAGVAAEVGLNLMEGLRQVKCGEKVLYALLADSSADVEWRSAAASTLALAWSALGRSEQAGALLDSLIANGDEGYVGYFPILAMAGHSAFEKRAAEAVGQLPDDLAETGIRSLWILGWWANHVGDIDRLRTVAGLAKERASSSSNPRTRSIAAGLEARIAATEGDTVLALALLEAHPPRARQTRDLEWDWDTPLPLGRMLLAELLLATSDAERALAVAGGFDGRPKTYLALVPRSLYVRTDGARAAEENQKAAILRERIQRLEQASLPSPGIDP